MIKPYFCSEVRYYIDAYLNREIDPVLPIPLYGSVLDKKVASAQLYCLINQSEVAGQEHSVK